MWLSAPPASVMMPRTSRAVERRRLGRREVLGHEDARLGEVGHPRRVQTRARAATARDADVAQVGDPLGEVAAERLELGAVVLDGVGDGRGPAAAGGELLVGGLDQALVARDQRGGLEDLLGGVVGLPRLPSRETATDSNAAAHVGQRRLRGRRRPARPAGGRTGGATCTTGPYARRPG